MINVKRVFSTLNLKNGTMKLVFSREGRKDWPIYVVR